MLENYVWDGVASDKPKKLEMVRPEREFAPDL